MNLGNLHFLPSSRRIAPRAHNRLTGYLKDHARQMLASSPVWKVAKMLDVPVDDILRLARNHSDANKG